MNIAPNPVKALVFDIDDTLYLERDYIRSGFLAVDAWAASSLGVAGLSAQCWAAFLGGARGRVFDQALRESGVDASRELVLKIRDIYRNHTPDINLAPDAHRCLELAPRAVRMAAISDGPLESQRAKAKALGLSRWLEPILFTEELGSEYRKPSTLAFQMIEERFGSIGGECAYVADNPAKDFAGPAGRGWVTCRVKRAGGLHEGAPSGPDVQVQVATLLELPVLLRFDRI